MAMSGRFTTAGLSDAGLLPVSGIDLIPSKMDEAWNLIQLANRLHTYIKKIDTYLEELKEKEKHEEVQRLKNEMVDLDEGFHLVPDNTHYEIEGSDDNLHGIEKLRKVVQSRVIGKESYKVRMGYVDGEKEQVVIQAKETFIGELSHEPDKVVLDDEKDSATLALALAIKFFNLYKRFANKIKSVKEAVFEQYKPGSEQDQDHKGVKDKIQHELIAEIEKQGLLKTLPKLPELDFEIENLKALLKWVEQIEWSLINSSKCSQPSTPAAKSKLTLGKSNELMTYSASNLEEIIKTEEEARKEAFKEKITANPYITVGLGDKKPSDLYDLSKKGQLKGLHKKDPARSYLKAMGYGILIGAAVGTIFWTWPAFFIGIVVGAVAFPVLKKVGSCMKKMFDNCFSWICGENEENELDLQVDDSRDSSPRNSIPYAELPDSTPSIVTRLSVPEEKRRQTISPQDQLMAETKPAAPKSGVGLLQEQSLLAPKTSPTSPAQSMNIQHLGAAGFQRS